MELRIIEWKWLGGDIALATIEQTWETGWWRKTKHQRLYQCRGHRGHWRYVKTGQLVDITENRILEAEWYIREWDRSDRYRR